MEMVNSKVLKIWYVSPSKRCNFKCAYCASNQPNITDKLEWSAPESQEIHNKIVDWVIGLPRPVQLRMNSIGEPFISKSYLSSVAKLTHAENLDFVEILTNGSFSLSQIDRLAEVANFSKLSLWMTFHHTQIEMEKFLTAASYAQDKGASVVVHGLIFPDSLGTTRILKSKCLKRKIKFHSAFGFNFGNAYPSASSFVPAATDPKIWHQAQRLNTGTDLDALAKAFKPKGRLCSAGHLYFFVNSDGDVYRCLTYSGLGKFPALGSSLDPDFVPQSAKNQFSPCGSQKPCLCGEDHQHLADIHSPRTKQRSFLPLGRLT